ncbi:serine hydrolase [Sphingomonas sp. HHU CXW]|uniref:Serine hydrolase n=1 Tax=Sphingomonas hominis TaxID=2741495 RepID=A0ABX2JSS5_9SPHN|nr:serine hydrolase [Sphingomonas hominis]NTS66102.1 serine hydrolase [Sphingomonas hominis]
MVGTGYAHLIARIEVVERACNARRCRAALIAGGGRVMLDSSYGTIRPESGVPHWVAERWRLASITKQVTATLLLHDHVDAHD